MANGEAKSEKNIEKATFVVPRSILTNIAVRNEIAQRGDKDKERWMELCKRDPITWINLFCFTKDPKKPFKVIPFITYIEFQDDAIWELVDAIENGHDLGIEKTREVGASWCVIYVFLWFWLFHPNSDFLVGSRKEDVVDKRGDPSTLFEKMRIALDNLPAWMLPPGFTIEDDALSMRIINKSNGNSIIGESANPFFGSGGRVKAILLDEFSKWDSSISESAWTSCYCKDTEVLTNHGWKLFKDLDVSDDVYSMNPENKIAKFMPILETYENLSDEMIHFKGKSVDLLVTKNHQIVYETKPHGNIFFKDAKTVSEMKSGSIPLVSAYCGGENPKTIYGYPADKWMEFLGWYISEGCTAKSGTIILTQSEKANPDNVQRIKNLLSDMGMAFSYPPRGKDFNVSARNLNKQMREELKSLGKSHEKRIPLKYLAMNKKLLVALWNGLRLGDGSDRARVGRVNAIGYTTVSKVLADQVQEIAQKIGYRASIRSSLRAPHRIMQRPKLCTPRRRYDVFLGFKTKANINRLSMRRVPYNDSVYCVRTEYHTLYVRRNGVACWCGNTADVTRCRIPVSTPLGSGNKFALLMQGTDTKIKKLTLHWTLHPEKSKGVYRLEPDGTRIPLPNSKEAFRQWLLNRDVIRPGLKGGIIRSPWYDAECERRTDSEVAQELDISYLKSGSPFFDMSKVNNLKKWVAIKRQTPGQLIPWGSYIRGKVLEVDGKYSFIETDIDPWVNIFEMPLGYMTYVLSGDTSEGLAKGDESAGIIRSRYTRHVIATVSGLYPPEDFARKLFMLGKFYNDAINAPENNNHGYSVCRDLELMGANLYYTRREEGPEGIVNTRKRGFTTSPANRNVMLDQMEEEIRKEVIELRDPKLIDQCKTFVRNPKNGKPEADGQFKDDMVMCCAIGGHVISENPFRPRAEANSAVRAEVEKRKARKNAGFSF